MQSVRIPTNRGFTLIELLIVVSITALLVALLLPALGSAREAARIAKCGSNLRQLRVAMLAYGVDFGDIITPFGLSGSNSRYWRFGLDPYLGHPEPPDVTRSFDDPVWDCPTHPSEHNPAGIAPYTRWDSRTALLMNSLMMGTVTLGFPKNAQVVWPSDKFVLLELETRFNTGFNGSSMPHLTAMAPTALGGQGHGFFGHHGDRTQGAFIDGHVRVLPDFPDFQNTAANSNTHWKVN